MGVKELQCDPIESLRARRSAKWTAHPSDVLPLTVAEMDYPLAPVVAEALHEAVELGDTGYATAASGLGTSLAAFARRRWGWDVDPARVTGVADVGVAVVLLLRALTTPGQAVVINTPVYPPFFDWVDEAGSRLVEVPLVETAQGWRLDLAALESAFSAGAAVYILCNPHNPVGRAHSPEELAAVIDLATRHGVRVVSDEIHGPLVLSGATFTPLLTLPGAAEVAASVVSASKAWNLAGLKCATVVTASPTMDAVVERFPPESKWGSGQFGVLASIAAYDRGEPWLDQLLVTLGRRRSDLGALLAERLPALTWHPPEATYLAWLDCRSVGSGNEPRERFLEGGRVALEPGLRFGAEGSGFVRLNFATATEILDEAVRRMAVALER
ncbi:MAG: MalY/PatB family protein [Acidimicrobiales bacterium]